MAKTDFKSVDEYIATHPEDVQAILQRVRSTIRKAGPGAEEVISYQIPTYKLHGDAVIYFAGWKKHFSLYPATDQLVEAFKDDLAPYEVSRGTIRFPLSQPVPVKLIEYIAKFRAKEAASRSVTPSKRDMSRGSG
ncbi:MAG: iron chaperone [Actinomycetota bacterium]